VTLTAYTRKVGWPSLSIASFIIFGVVVLSGSDLFSRMRSIVQTALPDRLALYEAVLHAISLRPALGWGANSFQDLFPLFQPVTMDPHYDKAHNTYLELAFELGMPAATALIVAVIIIALRCLRGARERKQNQYIPVCTLAVTVVVSVHALVDFGLQIAAIAIIFSAILGAGWRQSFSSRL
jgi:O-antigen ligase